MVAFAFVQKRKTTIDLLFQKILQKQSGAIADAEIAAQLTAQADKTKFLRMCMQT